jgi:transposase
MVYVGLDVHQRTSTICILDPNGRQVKTQTVKGPWSKLLAEVRQIKRPFAICFEATCGYGYLYEQLQQLARRVVVAHPGRLRLIFRSKRKNDRVDAEKLAKLLFLDEVPPAYVPSADVRSWRGLIEYRRRLVDKRTRCKNGIRSLLRSCGLQPPRGLWTRKGLAWLKALALPNMPTRVQRELLLAELETFGSQVRQVTKILDGIGAGHTGVYLLRTIPGVGARTAETVVAYLDDPSRFTRTRQVGAYFGLVPSQDASAGVTRRGPSTRPGPGPARWYLVEAAWQAVRRSPTVRAHYERIRRGRKDRRKTALVATAHYLLRCMYAMLSTGEVWREVA